MGIGAATAKLLASKGMTVVLISRSKDNLDKVCKEIEEAGGKGLPM